jgi:hypothetical protein
LLLVEINAQVPAGLNRMKLSKPESRLPLQASLPFARSCVLILALFIATIAHAGERLEFTRMVAHWAGYADPGYLPFIDDVKPEIAQVGFYGAHFWSLVDTTSYGGYPANFPVRGHRECGEFFAKLNKELHQRGVKVVGHLNVKFLVGDPDSPEGPRGFFKFYRDQWDEKVLGPKPAVDALELLEKDKSGKVISPADPQTGKPIYGIGGMREYWGCLNNPNWRTVLKAWVRYAINQGVDGLVANYFYRKDCLCEYCVRGFRQHLSDRFTADELRKRFSITNINTHEFEEILDWHEPKDSTPFRREMLQFSQISNKRAFDEVFVKYGRSLKPDLIVAQWNHLGNFNQISGDERCLLPGELWGRDEDYLWYSTGGVANSTDLAAGVLGDATLQARYIRGSFDDKPYTLGKYESVRFRVSISELAANGGAPMGFYAVFEEPEARREFVRYYGFLRRNENLYRANQPKSEVLLLFPRLRVHEGDVASVARFKELGKRLLDEHVLFDILPDDRASKSARSPYAEVIDPSDLKLNATNVMKRIPRGLSHFKAPQTVRVSLSRPAAGNELTLHLVNYNREEPSDKKAAVHGIKNEKPIAAPSCHADLKLDSRTRVQKVEFLTPELEQARIVDFDQNGKRLRFNTPEFLVYGVVRIQLSKGN